MKVRAFIVAMTMGAIGIAATANCGSDNDTPGKDAGSSGPSGTISLGDGGNIGEGGSTANKTCTKLTCADLNANCGPGGDGCGGVIQCGTCTTGTCGGGGTPSQCGGPSPCQPKKCDELSIGCGPAGDGCGGTLDCGTCTAPELCGGAGPSKCGGGLVSGDGGLLLADGGVCQPRTTCNAGECGPVADGCGGLLTCAGCGVGQFCGAVTPSMCGVPTCVKQTCAQAGADCGFAADGCGGILDCGGPNKCDALGEACGLGGPNKCGGANDGGIGNCANFCVDQLQNSVCAPSSKTKVTGTVYAPNGKLPLPGVQVFVPNGSKVSPFGVADFTDGTASGTCDQCNITGLGNPLVSTTSLADGTFVLDNVPPGISFPIVFQLGRWRRMITVGPLTACSSTPISPSQARFPIREFEGSSKDNIPLIAISTGSLDAIECLFYKLGVDPAEFSNPDGTATKTGGRIRLYLDNDVGSALGGARVDGNTPRTDQMLTDSATHLNQYDAVVFACPGAPDNRTSDVDQRVRAYADRGGRVFATHYNYTYLYDNPPWSSTVTWDTANERNFDTATGLVNTSFPKGLQLSQWLAVPYNNATGVGVGGLSNTAPAEVALVQARNNADLPMGTGAESWITNAADPQSAGGAVFHYTFNTPVGANASAQCGRVLFSDFHVSIGSTANAVFPNECTTSPLTSQEKLLSYFLFDLTSCIQPDIPPPPPACTKKSCTDQNIACGQAGDGCGGSQTCAACPATQVCQGNKCVTPSCPATTCLAQGAECGQISDGCGSSLPCGTCPAGETCGGGGPNKCGSATCTKLTCDGQNIHCGPAGDGCGNPLDCGTCPTGQTCGGGGVPNQCGAPTCTRRTCAEANAECGPIADGCGGLVDCGTCPSGTLCGYGGIPNRCATVGPAH